MTTDTFTADLMAATAPMRAGDKATSRVHLQALWDRIAGNPVHEFVLAHQMADAQDDPNEELVWDLRALDAAHRATEADVQRHYPQATLVSFWPSLHINLAEDYFKLGDLEQSRAHLTLARQTVTHLPDDPYGQLIRRGIERLAKKLAL
jgi:hypothetical protein